MSSINNPLQQSLTRLSIETAVLANAGNAVALLGYVIKKSKEVYRYKKECEKLANMCIALSVSFTENQAALENVQSGQQFFKCLQETVRLFEQCTQKWSIRHLGWEVIVEGRLERLQKDLELCQRSFNTEIMIKLKASTSTATRSLSDIKQQLDSVQESLTYSADTREEFLTSVRSLRQDLDDNRRDLKSMKLLEHPKYPIVDVEDERLQRASTSTTDGLAVFDGQKAILQKIHADTGRYPRLLKIYRQMGETSRVQKLLGVAEDRVGNHYAILESLAEYDSMSVYLAAGKISSLPFLQQMQFAYDLASTLSSLHENRLLVKIISDKTIYVKNSNSCQPVVSGLEQARDLFEPSSHLALDPRYEAPEVCRANMHSKASDVWSLGILLTQWFTGTPLSTSEHTPLSGDAISEQIRLEPLVGHVCMPILQGCLSVDPFMRPSANVVAQGLLDGIMVEATKDILQPKVQVISENEIGDIIQTAQACVKERKSIREALKKKQQALEPKNWIKASELVQLLNLQADEKPYISHLIGMALFWGIVEAEDGLPGVPKATYVPDQVTRAKQALPHLQRAYDLGLTLASDDLYYAHRALGEFYQHLSPT